LNEALLVFIYGIGGVFSGMATLYVTMKLIALISGRLQSAEEG
jgi:hypothetical protein